MQALKKSIESPVAQITFTHDVVQGYVAPGFECVHEAFTENFIRRRELGGACCAFYRGEKVVDLWGGIRNKQTGEPWEEDTMVLVYSTTKGLAAMTLAMAHSRGWLATRYNCATGAHRNTERVRSSLLAAGIESPLQHLSSAPGLRVAD